MWTGNFSQNWTLMPRAAWGWLSAAIRTIGDHPIDDCVFCTVKQSGSESIIHPTISTISALFREPRVAVRIT
uniref:Uncharacterized protein n=1 Tax=Plectus sambesii TaxID=2011161 RepID=A0A914WFH7_9BILA